MDIKTYSPNNNVSMTEYADGSCALQICNSITNEEAEFKTDTPAEASLIADMVLQYYADKETDYTYYPLANVSTRTGSFWRFDIVGTQYCDDDAIEAAKILGSGSMLLLVRERDNEYDENAIRVMTVGGKVIGYVPARRASEVARKMGKVGLCWIETNCLKYGDVITVIFSFDMCRLERFNREELSKPRFRVRAGSDNPFYGKIYETMGRFKMFPSQGEVHRALEDLGAVAYWHAGEHVRPEIIILGSSSPTETLEIVERMKAERPSLVIVKESELAQVMEQCQPGWLAKLAKPKKTTKETPKSIGSARAYISKTLKKVENGADPIAFRQSLQERVNAIIEAGEPMGESLRQRLRSFGVNC